VYSFCLCSVSVDEIENTKIILKIEKPIFESKMMNQEKIWSNTEMSGKDLDSVSAKKKN
jgi:hypothetical protein